MMKENCCNKDAYLIIAHKQLPLLKKLIEALDYPKNDIFVHIDKKCTEYSPEDFNGLTEYSGLDIYQEYDVRWGDSSQVDTEMLLFKNAYQTNRYRYYHLISGQDLPIKPVEEIYHFFDEKTIQYLEFGADPHDMYRFRLSQYHSNEQTPALKKKYLSLCNLIDSKLHRDRLLRYGYQVYKGSNWCSLSGNAVSYLVKNRSLIRRLTRNTLCADEVYKHTVLMNALTPFSVNQCEDIRYIDWIHHEGNSPHTLTMDDYELLKASNCLFARKFDMEKDEKIIKKILQDISK